MTETKIVELIIQDDNQELAIDAISLVTSPAIEQDFVFFGKEKNNLTFAKVDEEKRMLISPALIPNKQIFRHDPNTDSDYYVFFSKATVEKAAFLYLKHNNHHKATYQHQDRVSGVLTVESWIKEGDSDKSKLYGYDLPNGTWFVKMKIENDELWQEIKSGSLRGLSIEGYFTNRMQEMAKKQINNKNNMKPTTEQILSALNKLIKESKTELKTEKVNLGIAQDLRKTAEGVEGSLKTADKIIVIANKVNTTISNLSSDVKFYNKYKELVEKDLESAVKRLKSLKAEAEKAAKELGISVKDIDGYKEAQASLYKSENALGGIEKNRLEFDI